MTLLHILVFTIAAFLIGRILPWRWRGWALLAASLLAIYWLQPATPIRNMDFWFPTASLGLAVLVWAITRKPGAEVRQSRAALILLAGLILAIGLTRYMGSLCCLTPTRPPAIGFVLAALALLLAAVTLILRLPPGGRLLPTGAVLLILAMFIVLKTEGLAQAASAGLRSAAGQSPALATALDLRWLGFSYLAFRLLHALRDHQAGILPPYTLGEFAAYAVFFPAYTAGPIDRSQRFIGELRRFCEPENAPVSEALAAGSWRLLLGIFKKFAIADSLALFALNDQNAAQATSPFWTWVLLYAFALRLYFDFSGYTDIAIGLGRMAGINLPENFTAPYLKTNLTTFWNSWHITLANWFRAYFFNPFTRFLRSRWRWMPVWVVILAGQLGAMLLIGLWHGIALNFALWGAWHGLGLFFHNRWSSWIRPRLPDLQGRPRLHGLLALCGWLLTFHYVTLGWVWFVIPDAGQAAEVFKRLVGL